MATRAYMRVPRTEPRRRVMAGGLRLGHTFQFLRSLWAVDHGLQSLSKRMRQSVGLTGPQRLVVRVLGSLPELGAGELAEILHLHPSTLTGILHRLERAGVVTRTVAPDDRRRAVLRLTPAGRALDRPSSGTVEAAVRRALRRADRTAVRTTVQVLSQVARALDVQPAAAPARTRRPRSAS